MAVQHNVLLAVTRRLDYVHNQLGFTLWMELMSFQSLYLKLLDIAVNTIDGFLHLSICVEILVEHG